MKLISDYRPVIINCLKGGEGKSGMREGREGKEEDFGGSHDIQGERRGDQ